MAWTQTDIDTLKESIASGALKVRFADGRETTYRSLREMRETLSMMEAEVATEQRPRIHLVSHRRGTT